MADISIEKIELEECPYKNPALMNYECDGQMNIMDFLQEDNEKDK